jgi:type II secretory ATPase GspE/PulE/Tfp pilus assembly ATPase PilB-like protein
MDLGLLPDTRDELLALFDRAGGAKKTGLVLVCGRACSGKTTALYALLNHVKKPDIKIVTIECPVERALEGLVQVPVNTAISVEGGRRFDHATALRHAMRFDPDIVMTDEMGDSQTSELVLEAARSCLVLTSIYVRGAGDALARLADMGLPAYKMSAALKAVLTLRLARRLCETCKTPREPDAEERELFEKNAVDLPAGSRIFGPPKGGGCTACRNLGFKGRAGVHELLFVDDEIRSALMKGADVEALRAASRQKGMRRLAQDGLEKVKLGLTTISEALGGSDD